MSDRLMWQAAAYPANLAELVPLIEYKDWCFTLDTYEREVGGEGLTLRIRFPAPDNCDPTGRVVFLIHDFEVPARTLDDYHWQHWVFSCVLAAERHESMEQFLVAGEHVFFPAHDALADMYEVRHTTHRRSIG